MRYVSYLCCFLGWSDWRNEIIKITLPTTCIFRFHSLNMPIKWIKCWVKCLKNAAFLQKHNSLFYRTIAIGVLERMTIIRLKSLFSTEQYRIYVTSVSKQRNRQIMLRMLNLIIQTCGVTTRNWGTLYIYRLWYECWVHGKGCINADSS